MTTLSPVRAMPRPARCLGRAPRFVAAAGAYMEPGYLRPIVDVESHGGFSSNGYNLSSWVAAFIAEIKRLKPGVNPLIYCNSNYAKNHLTSTAVSAR